MLDIKINKIFVLCKNQKNSYFRLKKLNRTIETVYEFERYIIKKNEEYSLKFNNANLVPT